MARCSRCKQEQWPLHKRKGYLNCEPCLAELSGGFRIASLWSPLTDLWGRLKRFAHDFVDRIRGIKQVDVLKSRLPQIPSNQFSRMRPVKLVRIGGSYQKVG